jgi:hypothetical protein
MVNGGDQNVLHTSIEYMEVISFDLQIDVLSIVGLVKENDDLVK